MKGAAALLALLAVAVLLAWWFGPREPADTAHSFDPAVLGEDLDAWLAAQEGQVTALRPGAEKRIVWAGAAGEATPLSVVYLHGFSASAEEIRPVPDLVAERLGANLYFARLAGHGRDGPAMAEATVQDWVSDVAEAMAIGRRIGARVIVIGTSTGGTLAAHVPHDPALAERVAGIAFVSPNFGINHPAAPLLTWPWARQWAPALFGAERSFAPVNERHALHWTTRYPSVAVLPMAALVGSAIGLDHRSARIPAIFLYSEHDAVVSPAATGSVVARWGGTAAAHPFVMGRGDDPASHVIAGDILSPGQTERAVEVIVRWAEGL
ncbi:MAG: alpha/beta fold hydrolase [Pseudomonadota bacterium]